MRHIAAKVTPCILVLVALPVLFLAMPDGTPFVSAQCTRTEGTFDPSIDLNTDCTKYGYTVVDVSTLTVSVTSNYCELNTTVYFTAPQACSLQWVTYVYDGSAWDFCAEGHPITQQNSPLSVSVGSMIGEKVKFQLELWNCDCGPEPFIRTISQQACYYP
jgi:hypothetical protein